MAGNASIARPGGEMPICVGMAQPSLNGALQLHCSEQRLCGEAVPPMPGDFASMHDVMVEAEHESCEDVPKVDLTPPSDGRKATLVCLHGLDRIHRVCQSHRHMYMKRPPISQHTAI